MGQDNLDRSTPRIRSSWQAAPSILPAIRQSNRLKSSKCNKPGYVKGLVVDKVTTLKDEECRIQAEIIEDLTNKLAKKEQEIFLLKQEQQTTMRTHERNNEEFQSLQLQHNNNAIQLKAEIAKLQKELRDLIEDRNKHQCEMVNCCKMYQALEMQFHHQNSEFKLVENKYQQVLGQLHELSKSCSSSQLQMTRMHDRIQQLESSEGQMKTQVKHLTHNLTLERSKNSTLLEDLDKIKRNGLDLSNQYDQEKRIADGNIRKLSKSIKELEVKCNDKDKKYHELSCQENRLRLLVLESEKEIEGLNTIKSRLQTQRSIQMNKISKLETFRIEWESEQKRLLDEIEIVKKHNRDICFQLSQAKEEIKFLSNRVELKQLVEPCNQRK